jgi:sigma-B regulation protein RsbU (phosphoserine phosphatase)
MPRTTRKKTSGIPPNVNDLLLLQRVAVRINSILDLDLLLEQIVNDVAQTFGCSRSAILLVDEAAGELVIAAVRGWTVNYHVKGDRFRIGSEGMVGYVASTGETCYAPDVRQNPHYIVSEQSTRSEIDIPLKVHGRTIGVFNAQTTRTNGFSAARRRLLEALAGHIATAIENARLFGREREQKNRMAEELARARDIQMSLIPSRAPEIPGFAISGLCIPCMEAGGDWFDYIPLSDGRLGIVLADVSGKGMGASLLMSSTRSLVRVFAEQGLPPGEVLFHVNRLLLNDFPKPHFVTMVYALLDPQNRNLVFASAGHPWPLLVSGKGEFLATETGLPLGLVDSSFSERTVSMFPGTSLLLYSDGISEAMNPLREEFGAERLRRHAEHPSVSVVSILEAVRTFTGDRPAGDDMTVVLIRAEG